MSSILPTKQKPKSWLRQKLTGAKNQQDLRAGAVAYAIFRLLDLAQQPETQYFVREAFNTVWFWFFGWRL